MGYKSSLPLYQPKFEAWLLAHGLSPDCPLADLPKNWRAEYVAERLFKKMGLKIAPFSAPIDITDRERAKHWSRRHAR